jgi:hypothetical protein
MKAAKAAALLVFQISTSANGGVGDYITGLEVISINSPKANQNGINVSIYGISSFGALPTTTLTCRVLCSHGRTPWSVSKDKNRMRYYRNYYQYSEDFQYDYEDANEAKRRCIEHNYENCISSLSEQPLKSVSNLRLSSGPSSSPSTGPAYWAFELSICDA